MLQCVSDCFVCFAIKLLIINVKEVNLASESLISNSTQHRLCYREKTKLFELIVLTAAQCATTPMELVLQDTTEKKS